MNGVRSRRAAPPVRNGIGLGLVLVDAATRRAGAAGLPTAIFIPADAQVYLFERGGFDAAISRFGVMFFADPTGAFSNIRRALRPGGKLAFAAWRSPYENPFLTAAVWAAAPLLPELPTVDPDAPGQFAFSREDRIRQILAGGVGAMSRCSPWTSSPPSPGKTCTVTSRGWGLSAWRCRRSTTPRGRR